MVTRRSLLRSGYIYIYSIVIVYKRRVVRHDATTYTVATKILKVTDCLIQLSSVFVNGECFVVIVSC